MSTSRFKSSFEGGGSRQVTIFFSDLGGFSELTRRVGDVEAGLLVRRHLGLQEVIITREDAGQVLQCGGDSIFAVFDRPSDALNRALEIQRVLGSASGETEGRVLQVRIGLHMGEVLIQEGERVEVISRHVNRAHRVMEAAAPGQVFASETVVEAGRDFINVPKEFLAVQHHGEFFLKGVGTTALCEVADLRFQRPAPPKMAAPDKPDTALGERLELAGFHSLRRLGEGTSGTVFEARQSDTGKPVALKVLAPAVGSDPAARRRLAETGARTRQAQLPGVVPIAEERLDHQPPFLVMERVEGQPIDLALAGAAPERVAGVFRAVCEALGQAHAAGLVHGNLKPGNLLLRADGTPALLDFGGTGVVAGTPASPAWLAPELIAGEAASIRSDLYALGLVMFKVLTGREAFQGASVHHVVHGQLHEDAPLPTALNPQVPDALQRICLKALEKPPAERYASTAEMAADLDHFLRGELVRTRPTAYENQLFHRVREHLAQVRAWAASGLLNDEEVNRLLAAYEGLQRRGLPAVMEGRVYHAWQTLVYFGGWAIVNGALLWLLHWESLSPTARLLLGGLPAFLAFVLAAQMLKLERFRLGFVALVIGIMAVPLLCGVWLHEFHLGAWVADARLKLELFKEYAPNQFTNQQILGAALAMLGVAAVIMVKTRTVTHSVQAMLATIACFSALLLVLGLRADVEDGHWAVVGFKFLPLLAVAVLAADRLLRQPEHQHQAGPWINLSAVLLIVILYALARYGLEDMEWGEQEVRRSLSFLLLAGAGMMETAAGLLARPHLRHRGRFAVHVLVLVGLGKTLAGLAGAGWKDLWPEDWVHWTLFGAAVPPPHLAIPVVSIAVALLACRFQMFTFLLMGLAGFALGTHLLHLLYFKDNQSWPKAILIFGLAGFTTALYFELKRTRRRILDDVSLQSRL